MEPTGASFIVEHTVLAESRVPFLAVEGRLEAAGRESPGCRSVALEELASDTEGVLRFRTTMEFDSQESLLAWVDSEKRLELVREARSQFPYGYALKAGVRAFDGWFPQQHPIPIWKQSLLVLLTIYPSVLAASWLLHPITSRLDPATGMLLSNLATVAFTGWLALPMANHLYAPWLDARPSPRARVLGPLSVIAALAAVWGLATWLGL